VVLLQVSGPGFRGRGQTVFPVATAPAYGNQLPGFTGAPFRQMGRAPSQGNSPVGGQLGAYDGQLGNDPRFRERPQPQPVFLPGPNPAGMDAGTANNDNNWRGGIQGFNDRLTTRDRHAYWDKGSQRTGTTGFSPAGMPNTYNDPEAQPPAPEFRTVNRSVSWQVGSDHTAHQDDLTRAYTWLGEQGSGWAPVYGGVPGLYMPYGTRGGVPYAVVSPAQLGGPGDGPRLVFSGPPHGLHTQTPWKGGEQVLSRTYVLPQMRPVRVDRPSNSPQAGQSYSQTVPPQGSERVRPARPPGSPGLSAWKTGARGWGGRNVPGKGGGQWSPHGPRGPA
jgi:hypothetical protein